MLSFTVAILLASAVQTHAEEPTANFTNNAQDSMDEFVDKLVDNLVEKLFARAFQVRHADLDGTTLGKPAHPRMPGFSVSLFSTMPSQSMHQVRHVALPRAIIPSSQRFSLSTIHHPSSNLHTLSKAHHARYPVVSRAAQTEELPMLGGLKGRAMHVEASDIPSKAKVRKILPPHVLTRDTGKSLMYAASSVAQGLACLALGTLIPLQLAYLPLWIVYAAVTGTVWTGMWVIAHECGHGAFSDNKILQDTVGYILHSALLVPYFSWQHSHAVHHANTNHITKGETHVPPVVNARQGIENTGGENVLWLKKTLGKHVYPVFHMIANLVFGWPVYLMTGASGGPKYGKSNHFIPMKPFDTALWPGKWPEKVWLSDIGIVGMLGLLAVFASKFGVASVVALYLGPLIFTNCWLVGYTWLQHTDVDVPHLTNDEHSFMRGAFLTIDRPYGAVFDFLHHRIGSTHVAHHIDCTIPHYYAKEATDAIAKSFPKAYLHDPTPIHEALWRVATNCSAVELRPQDGRYTWVPAYAGAGAGGS